MATATLTDLQSLVNRLTADNSRLRNLVKLYEATFAASITFVRMMAKFRLHIGRGERPKSLLPSLPPKVREQRSFSQPAVMKPNRCRMMTSVSSPVWISRRP